MPAGRSFSRYLASGPWVLDSTTNYIEHPELAAERLERLARIVGQERVLAGTDCGFATFAHALPVDPRIAWAKLAANGGGRGRHGTPAC
jgi:5-methyltetrahydropteroyltriglutamate--homocysteine methyltransferase